MKTAVMTDTNSGIMKAEADSMGIFLIPMPVIINDETHYEGIDLTETSFYESLTGGKNVSTSQPSPGDLIVLQLSAFLLIMKARYRLQTITGSLSHRENLSCMQKSLQKPENPQKRSKKY